MAPINGSSEKKPFNVLLTGFGPFGPFKVNPSWLAVAPLHSTSLETDSHIITFTVFQMPVTYSAILAYVPLLHARPPVLPTTQFPPSPTALSPTLHDSSSPLPKPFPPAPEKGYDLVMHVGAGRPGKIDLEIQAHKSGYMKGDLEGLLPGVIDGSESRVDEASEQERFEAVRMGMNGNSGADKLGEPSRGFGTGYEEFPETLKTTINVPPIVDYLRSRGVEHVRNSYDAGRYCCDFIYYCSLAESFRGAPEHRSLVQFMHVPGTAEPYTAEELTQTVLDTVRQICEQSKDR